MKLDELLQPVQQFAPKHPRFLNHLVAFATASESNFEQLISRITESESTRLRLRNYIQRVFSGKDLTYSFIESGIYNRTGFIPELMRAAKHKLLPEARDKSAFHDTLLQVMYTRSGKLLSPEQLARLLDILDINVDFTSGFLRDELMDAIEVLSYRITATAVENEFLQTFRQSQTSHSFIQQNKDVHALIAQYTLGLQLNPHLVNQINNNLQQSRQHIRQLKARSRHQGVSLQLTYSLHRIDLQIERIKLLFDFYTQPKLSNNQLGILLHKLVQNEASKNRVRTLLNETSYLLAFQIAEHESKTGEHYIAENRQEYVQMFRSSCGGGVFAAGMTIIKIGLHALHLAPFWQAFAYSLNYASGFVGIQVSHATLATKQPAMTAARIAQSLDAPENNEHAIQSLALMVGKVARSQFISFVGNLLVVFPLSFAIAALFDKVFQKPLVQATEAWTMLHDVHPFHNPTWYYASITGVFLFLSGIISGYYDNKVVYSRIPQRLRNHKLLKRILPKRSLIRITHYIATNAGALIGNVFLGFFLGTAAFLGFIFGLPFDIRHITISSGNYAIALFTLASDISWQYALTCLLGVLGIGFFNFAVSFSLALVVAIRSRKIKATHSRKLAGWVWKYFRKYPKDFFFAPHQERSTEALNHGN